MSGEQRPWKARQILSSALPNSPLEQLGACLAVDEHRAERLLEAIDRGAVDWARLFHYAGHHLVTPSLASSLQRKHIFDRLPPKVQEYLLAVQALNGARNRTLKQELVRIAAALNRVDICPIILKGGIALMPGQYPGAEDRVIGDLDILIPAHRLDDAKAAVSTIEYRDAQDAWRWMTRKSRQEMHHAIPMIHPTLPVSIEFHHRILHDRNDASILMAKMKTNTLCLDEGSTVLLPAPPTRLLHNFLHAQITNGQAPRRTLNMRHLLEFSALSAHCRDQLDHDALQAGLQQRRLPLLAEYWAQAERWLGAAYPDQLPRSPHQKRELWLVEAVFTSRPWFLVFLP